MCFNATASFVTAAVLIPAGVATLRRVTSSNHHLVFLAAFPLLFGVQQLLEGLLWLSLGDPLAGLIGAPSTDSGTVAALGFLFFAYALWPALVPLAAWHAEVMPLRRRIFALLAGLGAMLGLFLYLPLLLEPGWLTLSVVQGSILYEPRLILDPFVSRQVTRGVYALIVALPLIGSSVPLLRRFGGLVLVSVLISAAAFSYAFVSIWCFFAAVLSAWLVLRLPKAEDHRLQPRIWHWPLGIR